ncbi:hypothetical protein TBR22_A48010 [Luteitalea sp. TBR-22]|nr:hypothetical protein TBR22_A48010 [Luteitalea sp. TBR-22]
MAAQLPAELEPAVLENAAKLCVTVCIDGASGRSGRLHGLSTLLSVRLKCRLTKHASCHGHVGRKCYVASVGEETTLDETPPGPAPAASD